MKNVVLLKILLATVMLKAAAPGMGYYGQYSTMESNISGNTIHRWPPKHSATKLIKFAQTHEKFRSKLVQYPAAPFADTEYVEQVLNAKYANTDRLSAEQRVRRVQDLCQQLDTIREEYIKAYKSIEPTLLQLANGKKVENELLAMYLIEHVFNGKKIAIRAKEVIDYTTHSNAADHFQRYIWLRSSIC